VQVGEGSAILSLISLNFSLLVAKEESRHDDDGLLSVAMGTTAQSQPLEVLECAERGWQSMQSHSSSSSFGSGKYLILGTWQLEWYPF